MDRIKIPPHHIESEQCVLGALMAEPESWDKIADLISERDFYRNEHKLIWRHIARKIDTGQTVDVITIAESIQATGKLDHVGGMEYLGGLVKNTPSIANLKIYAGIVVKKRKERDFLDAAMQIQTLAGSEQEIDKKTSDAVEILQMLEEDGSEYPVRLSESLRLAVNGVEGRYASPDDISGLKTRFIEFDAKTNGLHNGNLIIVAGRPASGKTTFAMNIADNVSQQNITVLCFSLEMTDEELALKALSSAGRVPLSSLRSGRIQDDEWPKMTVALSKLYDAPLFIDKSTGITAAQMHAKARKVKRKNGLGLIVIDYLQLMQGTGNNRNEELSSITRRLKLMAKDLNVPVILLSQLNRNLEQRVNKRPLMSDLRESGSIEQDADVIVMMYRDEYYNPDTLNKGMAEAILVKQRMGETGTIFLTFQGEYSRFGNFSGIYHRQEEKQVRGFSKPRQYKDD